MSPTSREKVAYGFKRGHFEEPGSECIKIHMYVRININIYICMYIVYIKNKTLYHIILYYLTLYYLIVDLHKHSYLFAPSACCQQDGKTLRTSSLEQNEKHLHPKISRRTNKYNHFLPSEV